MAGMGHRLGGNAEIDLPEDEVGCECCDYQSANAADQVSVTHQDHVPQGAHRAEAGALGEEADQQSGGQ